VSVIQPYEALSIGGVIDFQVDGARHLTPLTLVGWQSAHENKQGFLASSYSCTCHILAAIVALMVWLNHDENIHPLSFY
jgi:hypothetical protein